MDFWPGIIELLTAVFDFLRRTFAHFWYICFLMSMAYVRPSGGLLSEMCNIAQVLQHFLKGHIGAILTSSSHHDEIAIFQFFRKVDFCDSSTVILMILRQQEVAWSKWVLGIVNFSKVFVCFFDFWSEPLPPIDDPWCLANALLEGGRGEVNLPLNTQQIQNSWIHGYLCRYSYVAM